MDALRFAQNPVFERLARAGYVVSGLLHLILGYLAIRIAFGNGGGDADPSGALAAIAGQRGGDAAMWVATAAFLLMGLWRLVETVLGRSTDPKAQSALAEASDRGKALSLAVAYVAFAYSAWGFARGSSSSSWGSTTCTRELPAASSTISRSRPTT